MFPGHEVLIWRAEPVLPDSPRLNGKGLFGIIRKKLLAADGVVAERR
jgi:hypothetical protein